MVERAGAFLEWLLSIPDPLVYLLVGLAAALENIGEAYESIHEIWAGDPFRPDDLCRSSGTRIWCNGASQTYVRSREQRFSAFEAENYADRCYRPNGAMTTRRPGLADSPDQTQSSLCHSNKGLRS